MNLNIGPGADPKVDNWGHLGGGITGFFASIAITEDLDADAYNKERNPDRFTEEEYKNRSGCCKTWVIRRTGQILLTAWLLGLTLYFYIAVDVDNMNQESLDGQP